MPACVEQPAGAAGVLAADERLRRDRPRRPAARGRRGCRSVWRRGRAALRAACGRHGCTAVTVTGGHSRSSTTSPTCSPQRPNAPASASTTARAFHTGTPTRWRCIRIVFEDARRPRRGRRRRAGTACRSCGPSGSARSRTRPRSDPDRAGPCSAPCARWRPRRRPAPGRRSRSKPSIQPGMYAAAIPHARSHVLVD